MSGESQATNLTPRLLRSWSIRGLMAWIAVSAFVIALFRVWPLALVALLTAYAILAVVAILDAGYRLAFGPRPRGFPWPWRIVAAPVRLLRTATLAEEGGTGRAIFLAIATLAVLIGGAAAWKLGGASFAERFAGGRLRHRLADLIYEWRRVWGLLRQRVMWEQSWRQALQQVPFWWLLFGTLTMILAARSRDRRPGEIARRFSLFSLWLVVIEAEHLWAFWISITVVGTGYEPDWGFAPGYSLSWVFPHHLMQAPATFATGVAFFRGVGGWRWVRSIVAAAALVPVAAALSMLWFWRDLNPYMRWFPS